jgi:hypothetical protein
MSTATATADRPAIGIVAQEETPNSRLRSPEVYAPTPKKAACPREMEPLTARMFQARAKVANNRAWVNTCKT